ncbi:MAG: hypothetical protein Fur0046_39930 [Cyanobacteria bacterium J069]|nr:MAG: hypothetical protein D6742_07325 [Cyanobacteria bacterium J069]
MSSENRWWASGANRVNRWLAQNQQRSLETAYRSALQIQQLENQYFGGDRIAFSPSLSKTVFDYVKTRRDRQLLSVRASLTRFRLASFLQTADAEAGAATPAAITTQAPQILEKLDFIERVIGKYRDLDDELDQMVVEAGAEPTTETALADPLAKDPKPKLGKASSARPLISPRNIRAMGYDDSFLGRLSSLGKELSPLSEQEVVTELRLRRKQNRIAMRWLAVLLLLPLLTQVLVKTWSSSRCWATIAIAIPAPSN